ncbi:hypothetical protein LX32DRAFT_86170 [Colletotrichum zoysiae]|uniref:Uncharacterized protein n=1 Tax=Colletotrichum zoysiae TaxID=1216348 RepID=A0AAD9HB84_9PEZI|nr:hypothetical protein LX32DRAFT_86170 [Colletotrichum zoysiae]
MADGVVEELEVMRSRCSAVPLRVIGGRGAVGWRSPVSRSSTLATNAADDDNGGENGQGKWRPTERQKREEIQGCEAEYEGPMKRKMQTKKEKGIRTSKGKGRRRRRRKGPSKHAGRGNTAACDCQPRRRPCKVGR